MTVANKKLSLIRVEYENFKKLNISQEFSEDAKSVVVSGHNGAGKSSFIDGIFNNSSKNTINTVSYSHKIFFGFNVNIRRTQM
jgi:ABC-type transport system involved in cytochrome c biogenesis ATPase subunit